jgi:hypothetical protein
MERYLMKDANRPSRRAKKGVVKPLDLAELDLVTGDQGPVVNGAEDGKPGENKRLWGVFSGQIARQDGGTEVAASPEKGKKKSAGKPGPRSATQKGNRGSERALS